MPNYVYNRLVVISKSSSDIQKFYTENKPVKQAYQDEEVLSFNMAIPDDYEGQVRTAIGRDWRIENWGCKWDASNTACKPGETKLEYTFTTPWSPPSAWLTTVSSKYPSLTFYLRFEDEAFAFFALAKVSSGVTTWLEDYKVDDIITYLIRNHDVYPEDLIELASKAGLTQEVCLGTARLDEERFEQAVTEFLERIKPKYDFNTGIMRWVMERLLTSGYALFD
jgi:hypothetical protein